jgi:hypothetical protein
VNLKTYSFGAATKNRKTPRKTKKRTKKRTEKATAARKIKKKPAASPQVRKASTSSKASR